MLRRIHVILFSLATCSWAAQPSAVQPIPAPIRKLPWGQLNFLHTTDTHGWHAGHLQEPFFSADWGDYISFTERLQERADRDGSDLVVIDSGDRIEGNGLYDASKPRGLYDLAIFAQQRVDILCSGNHELYKRSSVEFEHNTTAPHFHAAYIASNLDVIDPFSKKRQPLAPRSRKFKTKNQGITIMAFGFLFNFNNAADNAIVQKVEESIKEDWFQEAIRDKEVDIFIITGHMSPRSLESKAILKAIRTQNWDTPIHFFGGHTHIRDYNKHDSRAYGLQSGRYFETVGFASINDTIGNNPTYARLYIDNNLFSYHHHTGSNASTFPTPHGRKVSSKIASARKALALDKVYGMCPQNYWTDRAPFLSSTSIFSLLQDQVFPSSVVDSARKDTSRLILVNTGAIRFDMFKGPITTGTMFQISPFTSGFRYIPDVTYSTARRLITFLNAKMPEFQSDSINLATTQILVNHHHASQSYSNVQYKFIEDHKDLQPGYTTVDDAGTEGDDTMHAHITRYPIPNCFETLVLNSDQPDVLDVVYNEFLQPYVLLALSYLGDEHTANQTTEYMSGVSMTDTIRSWVQREWKDDTDNTEL